MSPNGQSAIPRIVQKKHTFRVFGFIATLLIVSSLASFAAAFFYKSYVENQLEAEKVTIRGLVSKDDAEKIKDLESFERKLSLANMLLSQHLAPSRLLESLEKSTKNTVQFLTMEYTYDPGFQALLELSGGTSEIESVASQNFEFLRKTLFTDFVTTNISIEAVSEVSEDSEDVHGVTFAISGALDKSVLAYTGKYTEPVVVLPQSNATDTQVSSSTDADVLDEDESMIVQ